LQTTKLAPQLDSLPLFGGQKHEKIEKNRIFHFQIIKRCCEVSPIINFQWQNCSRTFLEDNCENVSKMDAYISIQQQF